MIRRILNQIRDNLWRHSEENILAGNVFGVNNSSHAGIQVDANSAVRSATFYSCLNVLSRDISVLPHLLYEEKKDGFRERAVNHPLYDVLRWQPNKTMTASQYWIIKMWHVILRGRSYSEIVSDNNGRVKELIPLHMDYVREESRDGKTVVIYTDPHDDMKEKRYFLENLFKVYAPFGLSVIAAARECVGLHLAQEQYAAKFFSNYAAPRGVVQFKNNIGEDDEALQRWKRNFVDTYAGGNNSWGVAVLENGAEFKPISISMQDAEFIDARKYQDTQICGLFPVPPHKIAILDRATFSNVEHQEQAYVNSSVVPWKVFFEEAVRRDLLLPNEKNRFHMEVLTQALLKGDTKARNESYSIARNGGWMSANDIRRLENENPIEDGDTYLVPLNMIPSTLLEQYLLGSLNNKNSQRSNPEVNVLVENNQAQEVKSKIIKTWRGENNELCARITPEEPTKVNGVDHQEVN